MQKRRAYQKSIVREILSSKARFISILLIIFLGTAFFSGIKSTSPDMNNASNKYYKNLNLMDSKIVAPLGFTEEDIKLLEDNDKILSYKAAISFDVSLSNSGNVVKFMEYDTNAKEDINTLEVVEGRLPENAEEIALDTRALNYDSNYKIGDTFEIDGDIQLLMFFNAKSYKIVGFVNSPMYIENASRGTSNVGKGTVDYFAVINKENINTNVYTELFVKFKNVQDIDTYSDEYKELMEDNNKYLKDLFNDRRYYYFDRNDLSGYSAYKDAINSIKNIASFLPLFFFLVAVLICLTTMTRMVEEKRIEIGTLKALGYSDYEISKKFIFYAAFASVIGSILGIVVGCNLFPRIIFGAYSSLFNVGKLEIVFYTSFVIQALLISIVCTVGAALVVLRGELSNKPCDLMRAKAPKIGKKILLERITPLWKRFNFNQKVTLRNIFRYKQRMLMTVFGIAGCMAMLVLGFSLKASNDLIVDRQFGQLWNYDAMVILNLDTDEEVNKEYNEVLKSIDAFESSINMHQELVTFNKGGMNKQTASLYVPEDAKGFANYITLRDRVTKDLYSIDDEGVTINEKLSKLLKVKVGDYIEMQNADNDTFELKVSNIAENYTSHTIYMSPAYYKKIFNQDVNFNAQFLKMDIDDNAEISEEILKCKKVDNVTFMSDLVESAKSSSESLNLVMVVIIVSAGGLAFIVLYNLNNINVSERIRELSTIKVLGFYDNEVTMYILRENIILTILGILTGSVLGKYVYLYILKTAELDNMMMVPEVHLMRYVTAGIFTLLFSVIVMIMMHIKLKKINMIDALKSVE